jgi:hypothetical protein
MLQPRPIDGVIVPKLTDWLPALLNGSDVKQ